jgi:oligoribonuclease (3'-5' exoribonuclease)
MFKAGQQIFTTKREVVGRASVVSDDLVQSVDQNICGRWRFTISEYLCDEFPQISRNFLYEMIIVRLWYHKFCARWVPKMLTGAQKT